MDKKIISVNVTSGHGFIVLTHTDLLEGGSISIGGKHIYKIEKDMNVEIPEGTYQVTAANDGYGDTKEVTVKRNETTVLNLDEYKGEGPKMGKVKFILQPEGTQLSIDGKGSRCFTAGRVEVWNTQADGNFREIWNTYQKAGSRFRRIRDYH